MVNTKFLSLDLFFMKPIQWVFHFESHLLLVFRAKNKKYCPFARKEMNNVIFLILLFRRLVFDQKSPVHFFFNSGLCGLI